MTEEYTSSDPSKHVGLNDIPPEKEAQFAVSTPRGKRISELAEERDIDADLIREEAVKRVQEHEIIIETDGKEGDPRLYRNPVYSLFKQMWRNYAYHNTKEQLESHIEKLEAEISEYEERTGYPHPDALVDDIGETDLSDIETPDTGELWWDVVTPWVTAIQNKEVMEATLENYTLFDSWVASQDVGEITGIYGDFSSYNDIEEYLGLD